MPVPGFARKLPGLPGWIALLFGIGAASVSEANVDAPAFDPAAKPLPVLGSEVLLWGAGGQVYLAQRDGPARLLPVTDTAQARRLRALLEQHGATDAQTGIRLDPMLLAGGGGEGFHWAPHRSAANAGQSPATPAADQPDAQANGPAPNAAKPRSGGAGDAPDARGARGR
jgi:hypothetical protein